jgi:hypothetical protein
VAVALISTTESPGRIPTYRKLLAFARYDPPALNGISAPEDSPKLREPGFT